MYVWKSKDINICAKVKLKWGISLYFTEEIQTIEIKSTSEMVTNKPFTLNVTFDGRWEAQFQYIANIAPWHIQFSSFSRVIPNIKDIYIFV